MEVVANLPEYPLKNSSTTWSTNDAGTIISGNHSFVLQTSGLQEPDLSVAAELTIQKNIENWLNASMTNFQLLSPLFVTWQVNDQTCNFLKTDYFDLKFSHYRDIYE